MPTKRNDYLTEGVMSLKCGRKLAYCEHGAQDGVPVLLFCGAGFGRRYVPTPSTELLRERHVRFITVDRPGYGSSDPSPQRTYREWASDTSELMDFLGLSKARFVAHSAGTPHLAAVCAFAPERVLVASLVCPVSPLTGSPPLDRPREGIGRGIGRFFLLYLSGIIDKLFGAVFQKWQADPSTFVKDTMAQIVAEKDVAFMNEHTEYFQNEYASDFGDAVRPPNGVNAMIQDMFHLNKVAWGFRYSNLKDSNVNIHVWYGTADGTAPHGRWICDQIGIEGNHIEDAGHGLIHNEFGNILQALLEQNDT